MSHQCDFFQEGKNWIIVQWLATKSGSRVNCKQSLETPDYESYITSISILKSWEAYAMWCTLPSMWRGEKKTVGLHNTLHRHYNFIYRGIFTLQIYSKRWSTYKVNKNYDYSLCRETHHRHAKQKKILHTRTFFS